MSEKVDHDKEMLTKYLREEQASRHEGVLSQLDILRKTRAARGGVGAPLEIPKHLKDAASGHGIVATDAMLDTKSEEPVPFMGEVDENELEQD